MIGYVLLITIAVVMGVIVYRWVKTYVPTESVNCPDDVSIFVSDADYNCETNQLNLTLKNSGKFSIAGYFIYASNSSDQELATISLATNTTYSGKGEVARNAIIFFVTGIDNPKNPGSIWLDKFNLTSIGRIYSIDITPVRYQIVNNKKRFVSCSNSKITQKVNCE